MEGVPIHAGWLELDGFEGLFKSRMFYFSVLINLLTCWDVAVCVFDLEKTEIL